MSGLNGKRLVFTRPAHEAPEGQWDVLRALGAEVCQVPLIEIRPALFKVPSLATYDWLVFTSRNAVRALAPLLAEQALNLPKIAAVGPATAQLIQDQGLPVTFVSPKTHAEGAALSLAEAYPMEGQRVLWPCGNLANHALLEILQERGATVDPLLVYQTIGRETMSDQEREQLALADMLVFTSPSAVQNFYRLFPGSRSRPVACLGPHTAVAAHNLLGRVDVEAEPSTMEQLIQAIQIYWQKEKQPS